MNRKETIRRSLPKKVKSMKKIGRRKREIKDRILSTFSIKAWNELTVLDIKNHTFSHCQGCIQNGNFIMLLNGFPINKHARLHSKEKAPTQREFKDKTKEIYLQAENEFRNLFPDAEFSKALTNIPELNLQNKKSWKEKRKETRKLAQGFKKSVETHQKDTAVLRTFGREISLAKKEPNKNSRKF